MRKFWSMRMLKYVKLRQHNFAEVLLKKRVCEDKSRSVYPDDDLRILEVLSFSLGFDEKIFPFIPRVMNDVSGM